MKLMRIQEMEEYILSHGTVSLDELCQGVQCLQKHSQT